jgi:predicted double-glycine peptidase
MVRSGFIYLAAAVCLSGCASQTRIETSFHSWKWHRDKNVVIQSLDYSCGAGALTTLMRYYFRVGVSEQDVLLNIIGTMSDEDVRDREKNGLSMLDLKHCAERMGYQAVAVRLKYASLPKLRGPVLIHLEGEGYKHFAVLRGVHSDRVFLADPSRGNIRMSIDRFTQEWTGVALVLGKPGFGLPSKYPLALDDQELVQNELLSVRRALYLR